MNYSPNVIRLHDMVRLAAPGAMDGIIKLETFNALREFFQRSDAWLFELPIYVVQWTNDYILNTGLNATVNRLIGLERPRSPPPPYEWQPEYVPTDPPQYLAVTAGDTSAEDAPMQYPSTYNVASATEAQNPLFRVRRSGVLLNAGVKCPVLRIAMNPSENEVWIATLSLNVADPTDEQGLTNPPDWVMNKWFDYIASGIICRLMLQPGKPYSSIQGAQYHGRKFNEGVGISRTEIRRMLTYGAQRWNFPQGWNSARPRLPSGQLP
jgi:hypothetical protein